MHQSQERHSRDEQLQAAKPSSLDFSALPMTIPMAKQCTSTPHEVHVASVLRKLHCSNELTDLPEELAELRYLRILRVKYNQIKRIPAVALKLPQLLVLELSGNKIQKVDDSIGQLVLLKDLDLSDNEIATVSDSLGTLPKLEVSGQGVL